MKLINREILEAKAAIDELLKEKMPVKVSWGLAKIGGKLNSIVLCIDPVRQGLFNTYQIYTEPAEDGRINVKTRVETEPEEAIAKFMDELNALMAQEVDLDVEKVAIPMEVDGKALEIKGASLMALEKFITVE